MGVISPPEWDLFLSQYPEAHLLQTTGWGALKSEFGWRTIQVQTGSAGAQILLRRLPLGFTVAYIPKGPVGHPNAHFWEDVDLICKQNRAVFLKIEPDGWEGDNEPDGPVFSILGQPSPPIQPRRTLSISLAGNQEDWLARMKQKTRYNIRLSQRKDVTVRHVDPSELGRDIQHFHSMMMITGNRDNFGIHSLRYYQRAFELFNNQDPQTGNCALLVAEYQAKPLAAVMVFARGQRAWYFYGASSNEERNRMPAYLIQWEAMRWAASQGCNQYDLWGVPDFEEEELEANFSGRSAGLWGVYRFKRGFGGRLMGAPGAWDRVYQPVLYALYRAWSSHRTPTGE
jgi:peptidoglycan pentaglycine glycine transferase (the first glycine)